MAIAQLQGTLQLKAGEVEQHQQYLEQRVIASQDANAEHRERIAKLWEDRWEGLLFP